MANSDRFIKAEDISAAEELVRMIRDSAPAVRMLVVEHFRYGSDYALDHHDTLNKSSRLWRTELVRRNMTDLAEYINDKDGDLDTINRILVLYQP